MQITRRTFVAGAGAATLLGTSLPAMTEESVTLDVLYSGPYVNKPPMEEIARQFEAKFPSIKIKYSDVKGYIEMTQLMLRGAVTGSVPDVGFQGLSFVRLFADRDLAVPLDGLIASEQNWSSLGYQASVMSLARMNGKTYGLPFEISLPTVYFNGDLVRQAGGDPDNFPGTWPEIIALAKKIKAQSGGIYFDYLPTGNWTFIALVQAQGGRMMTPGDRKIAFDGPEGMNALETLKAIGEAGMLDMTRDQAKQAFAGGSIGIFVTSSSDITLYTQQSGGRFDLRVSPLPVEKNGTLPAGGNAVMIHTRDAAKQKAAWEFVKFVTGPAAQTVMATMTSYMPVNDLAIEAPKLLGDYYAQRPNLMVPVRQLPIVSDWYSFPGANSLKITKVIEDGLHDVVTLRQSPQDAMRQMVDEVNAFLPNS